MENKKFFHIFLWNFITMLLGLVPSLTNRILSIASLVQFLNCPPSFWVQSPSCLIKNSISCAMQSIRYVFCDNVPSVYPSFWCNHFRNPSMLWKVNSGLMLEKLPVLRLSEIKTVFSDVTKYHPNNSLRTKVMSWVGKSCFAGCKKAFVLSYL